MFYLSCKMFTRLSKATVDSFFPVNCLSEQFFYRKIIQDKK